MFTDEEAEEILDYLDKKGFRSNVNPCKYPDDDLCSIIFSRRLTNQNIRAGYDQPSAELGYFKDLVSVSRFVRRRINEYFRNKNE